MSELYYGIIIRFLPFPREVTHTDINKSIGQQLLVSIGNFFGSDIYIVCGGGAGGIRIKAISAQLGLELGLGLSLAIQYLFLLKRDH